ncbi:MAG: hypothetical protein N3G20_10305 [Verrucomicrobiae bacterium]|nr:hypothetical protein [Verrucomicrobiae bacterium]
MKLATQTLALSVAWAGTTFAALPPAEQLLPRETVTVICIPDCTRFVAAQREAGLVRLWKDPDMAKFRESVSERLSRAVVVPVERFSGLKAADMLELFQGQLAVGVTLDEQSPVPGLTFIIDAGTKADRLSQLIGNIRTKLTESGQETKSERIRDVEFTTVRVKIPQVSSTAGSASRDASAPAGADPRQNTRADASSPSQTIDLSFARVGQTLVAGTRMRDLEKVVAKIQGGTVPCLAEKPSFEVVHRKILRDSLAFGWTDLTALSRSVLKLQVAAAEQQSAQIGPGQAEKLFPALGLAGLKSIGCAIRNGEEGTLVDLFLAVPQEERKGLVKLFLFEPKDSSPPPWVPANVIQFSRSRLDGQKCWAAIESLVNEISPGVLDFLIQQLNEAVRSKDPGFDFRRYFVQNLGDDMISYQKLPRELTGGQLASPPTLHLVSSANPEHLLAGIKATMLLMPPPFNTVEFKEREFLGKRIYSVMPPSVAFLGAQSSVTGALLHLSWAKGYLAVANETTILEEFLRSSESAGTTLAQIPGWTRAVQQVGGSNTGFLGYQNMCESFRLLFSTLKSFTPSDQAAGSSVSIAPGLSEARSVLMSIADFSTLPPFEAVSNYFGIFVCAGTVNAEGYGLRAVFTSAP